MGAPSPRRAKMPGMAQQPNAVALRLFGPIARDYERWAAVLSFGQDPRWRQTMVEGRAGYGHTNARGRPQ